MQDGLISLTHFIIEEQRRIPGATGDFSGLLNDIGTACKVIANTINKGALIGLKESAGGQGITEAVRQKLDALSNEVMLHSNVWAGHLAAMVSDKMETFHPIPSPYPVGKYLLLFDPLDGIAKIDINIPVGTIFSVLRSPKPGVQADPEDFLQAGSQQVCAGFALYGPTTMLVLTTGNGVNGFTLDRGVGEFILTHPRMRIAEDTSEFSINPSHERFWEPPIKRYVGECLDGAAGPRGKDFNVRWVDSLPAETFRILNRGGVFVYPKDMRESGEASGMRLMYEANPVSFIIEQAGGVSTTGREPVMNIHPEGLHQRTPLICGASDEVQRIAGYYADYLQGIDQDRNMPLFNVRSLFRNQ